MRRWSKIASPKILPKKATNTSLSRDERDLGLSVQSCSLVYTPKVLLKILYLLKDHRVIDRWQQARLFFHSSIATWEQSFTLFFSLTECSAGKIYWWRQQQQLLLPRLRKEIYITSHPRRNSALFCECIIDVWILPSCHCITTDSRWRKRVFAESNRSMKVIRASAEEESQK